MGFSFVDPTEADKKKKNPNGSFTFGDTQSAPIQPQKPSQQAAQNNKNNNPIGTFFGGIGNAIGGLFNPKKPEDKSGIKLSPDTKISTDNKPVSITNPNQTTTLNTPSSQGTITPPAGFQMPTPTPGKGERPTTLNPAVQAANPKLYGEFDKSLWGQFNYESGQFFAAAVSNVGETFGVKNALGSVYFRPNAKGELSLLDNVMRQAGSAAGTVAQIALISTGIGAIAEGVGVGSFLSKFPTLMKYVTAAQKIPFAAKIAKNVAAFDIYGQLNAGDQNRFAVLAKDTAIAIPFTLVGGLPAKAAIPANFALGYGLTKLSGGSNTDGMINGFILAGLTGVEKYTSGKAAKIVKNESLAVFNSYMPSELQIKANTPATEISKAYRTYAKSNHPDVGGNTEAFKRVTAAYEFLTGKSTGFQDVIIDPNAKPEVVKPAGDLPSAGGTTAITAPETPGTTSLSTDFGANATKYQSAKDFAEAEFGAKPTDQIGMIDAKNVIARDPVDQAQVDIIIQQMKEGRPIDPVRAAPNEAGQLVTTDGTQRITAGQQTNTPVPIIVSAGKPVEGLTTIEQVFNQASTTPTTPTVPATITPEQSKPVPAGLHLPDKGVYAKITPEQQASLKNEISNIPFTKNDTVHLTPLTSLQGKAKEVTLKELLAQSPNATKALSTNAPTTTQPKEVKLFHGTDEFSKELIQAGGFKLGGESSRKMGAGSGINKIGEGIYFASNLKDATSYTTSWSANDVVTATLNPDVKLKEFPTYNDYYSYTKDKIDLTKPKEVNQLFIKEGFGGISVGGDIVVFNPKDVTVTKNQAKEATVPTAPTKKKVLKTQPTTTVKTPKVTPTKIYSVVTNSGRNKTLPVLNFGMVKDGKLNYTNLETWVSTKSDLGNGMYKVVGEDFNKSTEMPADEFPTLPEVKTPVATILASDFQAIFTRANKFVSTDSTRPVLGGVEMIFNKGILTINATDGFRLLKESYPVKTALEAKIIVPTKDIARLSGLFAEGGVEIKKSDTMVSFSSGDTTITSKIVDGNYPLTEQIYPDFNERLTLDNKSLTEALKQLAPYTKDVSYGGQSFNNGIATKFDNGKLVMKAGTTTGESKTATVPYTTKAIQEKVMDGAIIMPIRLDALKSEEAEMAGGQGINIKYLQDVMSIYPGDKFYLDRNSNKPLTPLHFSNVEENTVELQKPVEDKPKIPSGIASAGNNPIGAYESVPPQESESQNFKIHKQVQELVDKYAKSIGESYLPRNAVGVYYPDTTNLRINGMNNLSTASHEITHFLDFAYNISDQIQGITGYAKNGNPIYDKDTKLFRKEITALYEKYYPGGSKKHSLEKRSVEGFATLLQKYIEIPTTIEQEFPNIVKQFLKPGGRFYKPVMGEIIDDLRGIVSEYQGLSALDKIGARMTSDNTEIGKKSFLSFAEKVRTEVADNIYPIEVLAKKAGLHFTQKDPSLWVRQYNNINSIILNNINGDRGYYAYENGEFTKKYDYNWKSLVEGLKKEKTSDSFGFYLVARRTYFTYQELDKLKQAATIAKGSDNYIEAVKAYGELKKVLNNDGILRTEATDAYLQNKDRFSKEEEMFDTLTNQDLKFLSNPDVQLLKPEEYTRLTNQQGYASFKRQFYDQLAGEEQYSGVAKVGKTRVSALLRRTGSQRTIINPVYSGLANHAEVMKKGLRQVVYNRLGDIGVNVTFPDLFQRLQLKVVVDPATGRFSYPQEKDPKIIMARVGYKRVPILTDNIVKRTVDDILTFQSLNLFEQILMGSSRFFTKGTTGLFPQFALTNYAVDQVSAVAITRNKYTPLYSPLKTFSKVMLKRGGLEAKYFDEYMVLGGEKQTFVGWQDLSPNELFNKINDERNGLIKAIDFVNKGADILAIPSKYSEIATRATEYIKARMDGKPQIVAIEEAGRVTAPFHHVGRLGGGRTGQAFVKSIPFFNPAIQVLDQSLRAANSPKGRKRYFVVALAVTAALVGSFELLMQTATEQQKQLYKDLAPNELALYLFFPSPDGKTLIKMRIPQELSVFGTLINMSLADQMLGTKYTIGDYLQGATAWLPQQFDITDPGRAFLAWLPQIFKPAVEVIANIKDFPSILPLENQGLQNRPPGQRFNESTSAFAKLLGGKLNISPVKLDYLITGYWGRAAGFLLGKPGVYNPFSSVIRQNYFTTGRTVENFYNLKEQNDQSYTDKVSTKTRKALNPGTPEEVSKIKETRKKTTEIADALSEYRKIDPEKDPKKAAELRTFILDHISKLK